MLAIEKTDKTVVKWKRISLFDVKIMPFAGALNNENFIAFNERFIILQSLLQIKSVLFIKEPGIEKQY